MPKALLGRVSDFRARALYRTCAHLSSQDRTYLYGGGHTQLLTNIQPHDGLDCSSSTCLALYRNGMYRHPRAQTSGELAHSWGIPGKGRLFTVWASERHVWVQFHGLGRFWRFDTSPWGSGGRGPRMRLLPRPTRGFTPRHWPGL